MRILLFSSSYAPRAGGLETVTRRLARELTRLGHEVTVVTNRYPRWLATDERIDGIEVHRRLFPDILLEGDHLSPSALLKKLCSVPLAPVALVRLMLLLARIRPDVVNVHYLSYPAIYALLAARVLRLPTVLSLHGSDVPAASRGERVGLLVRLASSWPGAITTCSEELRQRAIHSLPLVSRQGVIVAPNGVDAAETRASAVPGDSASIVVVARLVPAKGVEVAIQAMARLPARGVQARLDIAGDGPLRSHLEALVKCSGLGDRVRFHGQLTAEETSRLVSAAVLCVVPSLSEGFGIVVLEAMAAGKAVVASRTGGIPEIVCDGETGILITPGDAAELAGAIMRLVARPDMAREMGARGRERALRCFAWSRTVERYLDAFALASGTCESETREARD